MFNLFPIFGTPNDSISSEEFMGWKATQTPSMLQAQNELIEEFMKEIKNLREQQNFLYEENEKLKKENVELIERVNEIDSDVIRDLQDEILVRKNDYAVLKAQKHPMHPLQWSDISNALQKAKDLTAGVEVDLDKSLDEQCDEVKKSQNWSTLKVTMEDAIHQAKWRELPKTFPNEFQEEPAFLSCACGDCYEKTKQYNKQNEKYPTWEEAASDLALRVVKLEKKVEELKLINSQIYINKQP